MREKGRAPKRYARETIENGKILLRRMRVVLGSDLKDVVVAEVGLDRVFESQTLRRGRWSSGLRVIFHSCISLQRCSAA
ncbi:hypothetical protein BHM03_00022965 [Ensete ventricosum]|uniref:Uncharacterized protein n=1 Tax=Ensete ventricosum TaxID=4639 RepID=A0A445MGE4_ENSVE|nr:hypothetical protein BHM03_00022965 [Ensete ventricosum]